jgi:hypothetical protein
MNRTMNWLVNGAIVTGVTAALLLCVQGCNKKEPTPAPTKPTTTTAPKPTTPAAPTTAAPKPTTPAAPTAPKTTEPNKPAATTDPNKVSVKQAAGAVLTEAAKGAATGAATAAGNVLSGATTEKK